MRFSAWLGLRCIGDLSEMLGSRESQCLQREIWSRMEDVRYSASNMGHIITIPISGTEILATLLEERCSEQADSMLSSQ